MGHFAYMYFQTIQACLQIATKYCTYLKCHLSNIKMLQYGNVWWLVFTTRALEEQTRFIAELNQVQRLSLVQMSQCFPAVFRSEYKIWTRFPISYDCLSCTCQSCESGATNASYTQATGLHSPVFTWTRNYVDFDRQLSVTGIHILSSLFISSICLL